ncbi:MAG: winged helix-turn-helix domain-containing protein [Streptosporangiaceae bacterium]
MAGSIVSGSDSDHGRGPASAPGTEKAAGSAGAGLAAGSQAEAGAAAGSQAEAGVAAGGEADAAAHPATGLDETVHQRHRLGILTIASRTRQADFGYLRETLGLTSGNLSTHLTVLEDAGLVRVEKGYAGRRPRTWVSITRQGRAALAAEMDALARLVREHGAELDTDTAGGNGERSS